MKIFVILIKILLMSFLPLRISSAILNRISRTQKAINSDKLFSIIIKLILLPIHLILSTLIIFAKIFFIWVLPTSMYYNIKFAIVNLLYTDIVERKISKKVAIKRVLLFIVMIIKGRQRKCSFGDKNPDKTFFVIRPYYYMTKNELATSLSHLMFHYYRNLEHLSYAIEMGYIPVVDWENYGPFAHAEEYPINGTKNCWEYYWKQPSNYTLSEVYESKNVILSIRNSREYGYVPKAKMESPFKKYVKDLILKCPKYDKYFEFNEITIKYIADWEKKLFPPKTKILGVAIRGSSYGAKNIPNHPIQPSLNELFDIISKKINEWNIDYVFFTCESENAVNSMKKKFGEKVLILPRLRYKKISSENYNPLYENGERYKSNLDYVTEMALLSRCNSLIAAMSSGVRTAIIWNAGRYENMQIIEKGIWK